MAHQNNIVFFALCLTACLVMVHAMPFKPSHSSDFLNGQWGRIGKRVNAIDNECIIFLVGHPNTKIISRSSYRDYLQCLAYQNQIASNDDESLNDPRLKETFSRPSINKLHDFTTTD